MKSLLLVTADEAVYSRLLRGCPDYSIFSAASDEEALKTLRLTEVDLIVKDVRATVRELPLFVAKVRQFCPLAVIICLHYAEEMTAEMDECLETADFLLRKPLETRDFTTVLRQAQDKQRLMLEVSALRTHRAAPPASSSAEVGLVSSELSSQVLGQVVKEFAKALSASFDLPRVLNLFLDAVSEMVRPSRCALLLAEPEGTTYRVRAHRGLAPHVAESVRLSAEGGLPLWLQTQGRIIHAEEAQARIYDPAVREVGRELAMLQAVVAIPLTARGDLTGILTLGQRITGIPYSHRETEVLFNLAAHLALAIQDIALHHQLRYQKVYTERILSHMSNGVITIDRDEKVTIMNHRAEEILSLPASEILNRDLRALPSPLGDLLYETLTSGKAVHRTEVPLALRKLPLEVSTYPITGDGQEPLGAVMVFEDLSAQRQAAEEKRQAEQFQLLTRVIARISDEIKNPLVSINTFVELLEERYQDVEFRRLFSTVVGRDIKRLIQIFEKLAALVREGGFTFETVDVRMAVEECLLDLGARAVQEDPGVARLFSWADEASGQELAVTVSHETGWLRTRSNHAQLKKALAYLIWYLLRKTPGEKAAISVTTGRRADAAGEKENGIRIVVSSDAAAVPEAELQRLFDLLAVVQENLIDVGPCVSQRIIEALGGRLEAARGRRGISFTALLPMTQA
jgi:nitrogen-specific signal transduction histidine kinase